MLLKLRYYVAFNSLMAAIMRARSQFVYQYFAVLIQKHFYCKQADYVKTICYTLGNTICFLMNFKGQGRGCDQELNKVGFRIKLHFHHWESFGFTIFVAGNYYGYFLFKINPT